MYYGRYYSDLSPYSWWYCKIDGHVYDSDTLKKKFHYLDESEIEKCQNYIRLFQTDIISLETIFLNDLGGTALKTVKQQQKQNDVSFDTAFKIFEERLPVRFWHDFEKNKLREDAKKWCVENHFPFIE